MKYFLFSCFFMCFCVGSFAEQKFLDNEELQKETVSVREDKSCDISYDGNVWICSKCGTVNSFEVATCPRCGAPF